MGCKAVGFCPDIWEEVSTPSCSAESIGRVGVRVHAV